MQLILRHPVAMATAVTLLTLGAGGSAVLLADFGAPLVVFVPLLVWLATVGLPATLGVLLAAALWGRSTYASGFYGFLGVAVLLALVLQVACFLGVRRWLAERRKATACR